jgi:hypothetical protein
MSKCKPKTWILPTPSIPKTTGLILVGMVALAMASGCVNQIREPAEPYEKSGPGHIDPNQADANPAAPLPENQENPSDPTPPPSEENPTDPAPPSSDDNPSEEAPPPADDNPPDPEAPSGQCGNGQIEEGEICDGAAMGNLTCRSAGFAGGSGVGCMNNCASVSTTGCQPLTPNPIAGPGSSIPLSGALTSADPTWKRPNATCESQSESGQFFDAFAIVNNTGVAQELRIGANWNDADGYLHVFDGGWNPLDGSGCLVGNDDHEGTSASRLPDITIAPNQTMIVAVSTWGVGVSIDSYLVMVETVGVDTPPPAPQPDAPTTGCGNGVLDAGEICDGAAMGDASCLSMGYDFGFVMCSDACDAVLNFCMDFGENPTEPEPPPADEPPPGNPTHDGATATPANGLSTLLSGSLDDTAPQWTRPQSDCDAGSDFGHRMRKHVIENQTGSTQSLTVTGNWKGDGYLFVYTDNFSALTPEVGCLEGDDDFSDNGESGSNQKGSRIEDLTIFAGERLVIIASTYAVDDRIGDYSIDVTARNPGHNKPIAQLVSAGQTLSSQGTLHGTEDTWDRGGDSCTDASLNGDYFYDRLILENASGTDQDVEVHATWNGGDGTLHAYLLDSVGQSEGSGYCLAANDDFNGPGESRLSAFAVYPGEMLEILASTYAEEGTVGDYVLEVRTLP